MLRRATSIVGAKSFWFITMPRKEPPATTVASSPCSARSESTSSSARGSCHSGEIIAISNVLPEPLHRRDGPGLEEVDLLSHYRPLDVLRNAVTFLQLPAEVCESLELLSG